MEVEITTANEPMAYGETAFDSLEQLTAYIAANGGAAKLYVNATTGKWVVELGTLDGEDEYDCHNCAKTYKQRDEWNDGYCSKGCYDTRNDDETDPENIYNSPTMRQSIEEDRR